MEQSDALRKVRALIARAEHPNTPPEEARTALTMADAIMMKAAIDREMVRASAPQAERDKPDTLVVDQPDINYGGYLIERIAEHCRCMTRKWVGYNEQTRSWKARVYGFKSDLAYFEILYTQIMLHLAQAIIPRWDPSKTDDDNAYILHNAGFNWLEIAGIQGWTKYGQFYDLNSPNYGKERWVRRDPATREVIEEQTNFKLGSGYKRMYLRAVKARGEEPTKISAGGSETFRNSLAEGYVDKLARRMRFISEGRPVGSEIVLRTSAEDLLAFFKEQNPDLFQEVKVVVTETTSKQRMKKPKPLPFNRAAYARGSAHAETADLSGGSRMGSGSKGQLGSPE